VTVVVVATVATGAAHANGVDSGPAAIVMPIAAWASRRTMRGFTLAATAEQTDWRQILALYEQLLACAPTPVVALNRAVALAQVDGAEAALAATDRLDLGSYYLFHATRADLLRRLHRTAEAALAYDAALELTTNAAERAFLERQRNALPSPR